MIDLFKPLLIVDNCIGLYFNINLLSVNPDLFKVFHHPFVSNFDVILMIVILSVYAAISFNSWKYLQNVVQAGINLQTASRLYREQASNILHPAYQLEFLFILVGGVFILHIERLLLDELLLDDQFMLLINSAGIFLFMRIKYLLYGFSGTLFETQNETREYIFYSRIGNWLTGLFLMPLSFIMFFTSPEITKFLMFFGAIIVLFHSVVSIFRGVRIIAKKDFSIYYLILYLCSLEILPLIALWRILWRV